MAETSKMRNNIYKRTVCHDWNEFFMGMALLSAKLSRNPYNQVGVCIVNDKKEIIGIGYNGMLRENYDFKFYWHKNPGNYVSQQPLYVPHAEINALRNRNSDDVKGCTIYVTLFPCDNCAKEIIESGIKTVIYLSDKNVNDKAKYAKKMFDAAGVTYRLIATKIEINFRTVDQKETNHSSQIPAQNENQTEEANIGNTINNILFNPNYFTF